MQYYINKIDDLHNTLDKFIKGMENFNLIIGNQRATYNKVGLGYELKNNAKSFGSICNAYRTFKM